MRVYGVELLAKKIMGRVMRERVFQDDPERDVYLVSYPRSGNTWLRALMSELLLGEEVGSLRELDYIVPDVYYRVPEKKIIKMDFYVVKSHEPLRAGCEAQKYKRVIYVVRDPRNVVVSYYRYLINNGMDGKGFSEFVNDFVYGRITPCSWQEHVSSWTFGVDFSSEREVLFVRYEDLVGEPKISLRKIADFIGLRVGDDRLEDVISSCSREGMRKKELNGNRPEIESGRQYFIGPGGAVGKGMVLSGDDESIICEYARPQMERWGYI